MARETLIKLTQITSALTIHTPTGAAIVSLTTTQTTRTTSLTTCVLSLNDEIIRTQNAQQNAQLPQQLSKVFAKAVKPLLDVHRTAAQKASAPSAGPALGPSSSSAKVPSSGPAKGPHSGLARARPLTQAPHPSPVGTSTEGSATALHHCTVEHEWKHGACRGETN